MEEIDPAALESLRSYNERLQHLNEMIYQINIAETEDDIFHVAAVFMARIFPAERASVALLREEETFEVVGLEGADIIPMGVRHPAGNSGILKAIEDKVILNMEDLKESPYSDHQMLAKKGIGSVMNCPLLAYGGAIGCLNLGSKDTHAYTDEDQQLIFHVSSHLANNLENRRLYEQNARLLQNMLPAQVADKLRQNPGRPVADAHKNACVLFADLIGFTELASLISATELIGFLNDIFSMFDELVENHGLEKIKTIGDAYMVAGGLTADAADQRAALADLALAMMAELDDYGKVRSYKPQLRIGLHCGPVVAGVIGRNKFAYDIWGDTVNIASRLEACSEAGKIQISDDYYQFIKDDFQVEKRGCVDMRGKGELETHFLLARASGGRPRSAAPSS